MGLPRLNGIIKQLEQKKNTFVSFACAHPHVDEKNVKEVIDQGFRWLMPKPERTNTALAMGRKLSG
jgi:hypothetical protein